MSRQKSNSFGLSHLLMAWASLALVACNNSSAPSSSGSTVRAEGSEAIYKGTPISYSGSTVTITSTAQFMRWDDDDLAAETSTLCTSANPCKQGLVSKSTKNIRFAESHIYNKTTGALVQAGETDASGVVSMVIPAAAGTYTLEVHSRADNSNYKASILNNPYDKIYYKIGVDFTLAGSETGSIAKTLPVAPYDGTMQGGAFNILNDILIANEYLRAHANGSTTAGQADYCPSAVCATPFTVAPKVQVYWTKGLTPATYYGDSTTPISFFVPKASGGIYEGLYILGGIEGEICTDTDHFDNSVILHEYGHFLERAFGFSDSPGGSHNGNLVIDPRLAWSEGWADFFQSAALGRTYYRDTQKNADCAATASGGRYFTARLSFPNFDMETMQSSQDSVSGSLTGEGNFREMSIARTLYDTLTGSSQVAPYNANTDSVSANLGFAVIWNSFQGLKNAGYHGRNVGHLNLNSAAALTTMGSTYLNAWKTGSAAPIVAEKEQPDLRDYGLPLTPQTVAHGSCPTTAYSVPDWFMTSTGPVPDSLNSQGQTTWSDLFNTNDMFLYNYDGTAAHAVINLYYKKSTADTSGITDPWDLDLYVYKDDYVFLNTADIVKMSEGNYPEAAASASGYTGFETVNLSGLPAGAYYINVKAYYTNSVSRKATTQYYFELGNGAQLCP